jgi:hypothetical protein
MLCISFLMTRVPACTAKVSSSLEALLHLVGQNTTGVFPHTSKKDSQPTTSLFSKQVIPYWTRGSTCCPGVSTPKTRPLADLSTTNHITDGIHPSPPFNPMLKPRHRSSPWSTHITTDGRPTLSTLNTSQTQHHKDGTTCITLMTAWLSNTNHVCTQILKYAA